MTTTQTPSTENLPTREDLAAWTELAPTLSPELLATLAQTLTKELNPANTRLVGILTNAYLAQTEA